MASLENSKKHQESLKHNMDLWRQEYLAEHQALQALQTQHNALGKSHTEQAADTQRVSSRVFCQIVPDKRPTLDSGL